MRWVRKLYMRLTARRRLHKYRAEWNAKIDAGTTAWKRIETAPKDGTFIDIMMPGPFGYYATIYGCNWYCGSNLSCWVQDNSWIDLIGKHKAEFWRHIHDRREELASL